MMRFFYKYKEQSYEHLFVCLCVNNNSRQVKSAHHLQIIWEEQDCDCEQRLRLWSCEERTPNHICSVLRHERRVRLLSGEVTPHQEASCDSGLVSWWFMLGFKWKLSLHFMGRVLKLNAHILWGWSKRLAEATNQPTCINPTSILHLSRSTVVKSASSLRPTFRVCFWEHLVEQLLQAPSQRIFPRFWPGRFTSTKLFGNLSSRRLWQQRSAPAASLSILRPAPPKTVSQRKV